MNAFYRHDYASAFFFATFLGFTSAGAAAAAALDFVEAFLFNCVLIFFLFLDTPKEPMVLLPFAVFLSPLPMDLNNCPQ